jgi:hypothetical protein
MLNISSKAKNENLKYKLQLRDITPLTFYVSGKQNMKMRKTVLLVKAI